MKMLFEALSRALSQGEPAVLVTLTASAGSTPRGTGAMMLVGPRGRLAGTVGGGAVEYRCITTAQEMAGSSGPVLREFQLNHSDTSGLGMICGGAVQALFQPIAPGDETMLALCRQAERYFDQGVTFWLVEPLQNGASPMLWTEEDGASALPFPKPEGLSPEPEICETGSRRWFCQQVQRPGIVYIFGGGHVSQALVPVLSPLDFPCIVVENRPEFADPTLFPQAREVRLADFARLDESVRLTDEDYVCIMTRGHKDDLLVQQQMLRTPAYYIGLIGSAQKAAASFDRLREMGFTQKDLDRIVTPIGLPIGGRTPEEIAISIAAQLIQYRASRHLRQ
jgi:xanthine dehydrogenase accessory factor